MPGWAVPATTSQPPGAHALDEEVLHLRYAFQNVDLYDYWDTGVRVSTFQILIQWNYARFFRGNKEVTLVKKIPQRGIYGRCM